MRALLERLDDLLRLDRPGWADTLAPGAASPPREHAGRRLPDDLTAWFAWHDGHRVDPGEVGLVLDWKMLSVAQSLDASRERQEAERRAFARLTHAWRDDWLPLCARPEGELLVVALDEHPSFAAGSVLEVSPRQRELRALDEAETAIAALDAAE